MPSHSLSFSMSIYLTLSLHLPISLQPRKKQSKRFAQKKLRDVLYKIASQHMELSFPLFNVLVRNRLKYKRNRTHCLHNLRVSAHAQVKKKRTHTHAHVSSPLLDGIHVNARSSSVAHPQRDVVTRKNVEMAIDQIVCTLKINHIPKI